MTSQTPNSTYKTRRNITKKFVRYYAKPCFVIGLMMTSLLGQPSKAEQRPNIILFLIDDLSWADLGLTGSKFYETPHLDKLAREGVFFTDAYAANPVCSPTRASILTGKYPSRIGLTNHSGSRGAMGERHKLTPPEVVGNMPAEDITLAEALKSGGYHTAHIGKWHLQAHHMKGREHYPEANGFDLNIAGHKMGQPGDYYFPYKSKQHPSTNVPDMEDGIEGDYLTDALTDKAIQYIEDQGEKGQRPFFLNFWYYTVHTPIIPDKSKLKKYTQKAKAMGLLGKNMNGIREHQSVSRGVQSSAAYACMVESMDQNIGRIIATLKKRGMFEDTIIVFLSDNGGLSTGTGPNAPTSSLPLRAGKAWVYEGGIRSPLIISYPAGIKPGFKVHEPAVSTDIYPTLLDMAGLPLRPEQHIDGISLKPLFNGKKATLGRDALYFHYPHYHHINTMGPAGAIRMGDYKLIEIFETGKVELYNLREDMGEQKNLVSQQPQRAATMKQMLQDWRKQSGAAMTTSNPGYAESEDWRKKP
ncbi:MAG: sulfatase [Akkermansiaceae bacterium]|nr:sulfatase [Akkermansiaceae bacterium]